MTSSGTRGESRKELSAVAVQNCTENRTVVQSLYANKKALALLLKPATPTPSNTGSAWLFHRDRARRRISIPMCDQSSACNPHWHIRARYCTTKRVHRVTPNLIQHTKYCHRSMMTNFTLKHSPVRKRSSLTARFSSLWCVSAVEHRTANSASKTGRTKPWKHLPRSNLSWNTRQEFLKTPSLWEDALKTERDVSQKSSWNQMSLPMYQSHPTPSVQSVNC